jgi:sortase A
MERQRAPISHGGEQLLRELVESVPVSTAPISRPVALRSVALQRRQALAGYGIRNRLDTMLFHAEWLMGLAVILAIGTVAARGQLYDWLYPAPMPVTRSAAAHSAAARPVATQTVTQHRPALTIQPMRHITDEPAVADWDIQTPRDGVRARHPELGQTLPSSTEPAGSGELLDYVEPSQRYARAKPAAVVATPTEVPPPAALDLRPLSLEAPAVGLRADTVEVFLQDGIWQVADYAVGFHHGTGQPGEGNLVMAGHKGIRGAVFANLEALRPGDEVFVDTAEQRFRYQVRETRRVWPSEVDVMYPTPTPTLTLLTCTNWDLQRFVVVAELVDSAPRVGNTGG